MTQKLFAAATATLVCRTPSLCHQSNCSEEPGMALTCLISSCCLKSPLWEMSFLMSSLQHMLESCWPWQKDLCICRQQWVRKEL